MFMGMRVCETKVSEVKNFGYQIRPTHWVSMDTRYDLVQSGDMLNGIPVLHRLDLYLIKMLMEVVKEDKYTQILRLLCFFSALSFCILSTKFSSRMPFSLESNIFLLPTCEV